MLDIVTITDKEQKGIICESILRALPNWFGVEESIIDYVKTTKEMPFFAVYSDSEAVGFVAIKIHNRYTAEVCVMGILKEFHRKGIGSLLIRKCEQFCKENDIEFLTVKTLDESRLSKSYEKTRLFYVSMGFRPLEVFKTLWDESNPCLFMAKYIN
ncbi:GNAT family N-acetyltransferase [Alkaliphilus transvaalensis]|uniref:GNAT family N-acetyltransferase n=1 Tax=Alkaliphilus transvaalensis TaxID=114628 RepID=UPI00047A925D|nr:GNAT family N-acetyltransferase [Alkaliphilus transvaalensis]